jgi:hypothetical protein
MDQWQTIVQIVQDLGKLLVALLQVGLQWSLLIAWVAWWLWAVNWRRVWPVLAEGGWAPLTLLMILAALVWSQIAPRDLNLGIITLHNFWWQLCAVALLAGLTFFCGWLQGVFGWESQEISTEPPAHAHGHDHDHRDGHHG